MKKTLSIVFALIMALNLTACSTSDETESSSSDISSETSEPISDSSDSSDSSNSSDSSDSPDSSDSTTSDSFDSDPLPEMDGSTSATPLEIGLKSHFLGIPYSEAKEMVSHTTTHDSFKRLIKGEVDLIFSVPISEEQQKMADDAGVKLFMEPVAREGFVFVVNANNPVNSLTQDQLRGIYSGEITNWSQVGGNDEEILPYQRNTDSGSQNYMTVFMGDTPLLKPRLDFIAGGMAGIMDAVAVYDNSSSAIGYSVYSYAAQMYADADKVKFIAVDGVAPSKATMADESYPLLSCTYMIYTDKSPESAKEFVEKALSDEGQQCVLESGYLPVNGMEVPEKYLPYQASGTGEPMPAGHKPSREYTRAYVSIGFEDTDMIFNTGETFELRSLKDKELQSRINSDISKTLEIIISRESESSYFSKDDRRIKNVYIETLCRNGYLSIMLFTKIPEVYTGYNQIETLNYDLFSGEKIERFSDLFYEGADFLPLVNKQLATEISADAFYSGYYGNAQKLDFSGILGEPRSFTIDSIVLESDNPYFEYAKFVDYTGEYEFNESDYLSVVTQYRDMRPLFDEKWGGVGVYSYDNEWKTKYVVEGDDTYLRFTGSAFHTDEEVKAQDELWHELQRRSWEHIRKAFPDFRAGGELDYSRQSNYYYLGHHSAAADSAYYVNFDSDTLEIITMDMLVGEDWRQYLSDDDKVFAECTLYPSYGWDWNKSDTVTIYAYPDRYVENVWNMARIEVPVEKINKRYFSPPEQ